MGKIKREGQKFHITSVENKPSTEHKMDEVPKYKPLAFPLGKSKNIYTVVNIRVGHINKLNDDKPGTSTLSSSSSSSTKGTKIDAIAEKSNNKINKSYADPTTTKAMNQSNVTEKHLTKKEIMKFKYNKLMQKIDVMQQGRKRNQEKHEKKKPEQTLMPTPAQVSSLLTPNAVKPAAGKHFVDLKTLNEALPSLDDELPSLDNIFKWKSSDLKTGLAPRESSKKEFIKLAKGTKFKVLDEAGVSTNSKRIAKLKKKTEKSARQFVKNYNLLSRLMAEKKKQI